jgi:hypothetical protein
VACSSGEKVTSPESRVARLEITPATPQLVIPTVPSVRLTMRALDAGGAVVTGVAATWSSSNTSVATLSGSSDHADIAAVSAGTAVITATVAQRSASVQVQVTLAPVARVEVRLTAALIGVTETSLATAVGYDALNNLLSGRAVQWQSSNPAVASITPGGTITALAAGETNINATMEGASGSLTLRVVSTLPNLALDAVYLAQTVQRFDGSIPLVAGGNPVLVNVFGTLDRAFAGGPVPKVRISVFRGATQVMVDERPMTGTATATSSPNDPIHQVVLPSSIVEPGLRVLVAINPDSAPAEATLSDNRWPPTGEPADIDVRSVPPLAIQFVPIFLSNGGSTGNVSPGTLPEYLLATRQMHPVAQIDAAIGGVFSTDVQFGDGQSAAWQAILQQLDVLRVAEGSSRYYVGALRPPAGVTFVQFGGFGYIPFDPQGSGPSTRTAVLVGVGWFNRQRHTTELVAHELGHTMGRRHAPCGGAAGPDVLYPHGGAAIGAYGHDLFTWSQTSTGLPPAYGPSGATDIMSYCTPAWISDYTYAALLTVRAGTAAVAAGSANEECECLVVWGSLEGDSVRLHPSFVMRTRASLPPRSGPTSLEGEAENGRRLFAINFEGAEVDHAPGVRHFAFAIPLGDTDRASLGVLRARHNGRTLVRRAKLTRTAMSRLGTEPTVRLRRTGPDVVEVTWDRGVSPSIVVRDPGTDRIIAIGTSGRMVVRSARAELDVHLSDGVQSGVSRVRVRQ